MEKSLCVAKEFYNSYFSLFHEKMDEMKMHKLMYLVQRESLMLKNEVLFVEDFYGWKFGPVLKTVREEYRNEEPFLDVVGEVSSFAQELVKDVLNRYGKLSSWSLSRLSHDEFSWKCARKGLDFDENGSVKLEVSAMRVDAARELSNRSNENM